ncbi:hypothetical protein V6N13_143068 [Hibiscus sabdariffa]
MEGREPDFLGLDRMLLILTSLGQVDVISTGAMETEDAEDVPLEHSEGLKRQRIHSLSSTVSSNHVDSSEDISTLEAGLAN